jgi:hypothetical protein
MLKTQRCIKMISLHFLISNPVSWQLVLMDMVHSSTKMMIYKQWQTLFIMCDYKMKWKCYGGKQNKTCSSTPLLSSQIQHGLIIIIHSKCFYQILSEQQVKSDLCIKRMCLQQSQNNHKSYWAINQLTKLWCVYK